VNTLRQILDSFLRIKQEEQVQTILHFLPRVGFYVLLIAVPTFVLSFVGAFLLLMYGDSEASPSGDHSGEDEIIQAKIQAERPSGVQVGWIKPVTKVKVFAEKSTFISIDSLADGTATPLQRRIVACCKLSFVGIWLIIVGVSLRVIEQNLWGAVLIFGSTAAAIHTARMMYRDQKAAERRVARRRHRADSSQDC
jgi:hypothetical protein